MAENTVAKPCAAYQAHAPFWQLISDVRGGTPAMRNAGRLYLPQEPAEGETAYFNRLSRSVFTNFYSEAVDDLVGKPLKEPVVLEEDVPEDINAMMDNVDLQGNDLTTFARHLLQSAIDDGVTHVLVDFPPTAEQIDGEFPDGSLTLQQERQLGIRPYSVHIKALDMLGWKYQTRPNGEKVLTQIRYREFAMLQDPEDPYNQMAVERIRVYNAAETPAGMGSVEIWEKRKNDKDKEEWVRIVAFATSLPFIPLITLYTHKTGFMTGRPLAMDLAYLNIAHWQSDSDQRNIVHVARVPILFGTGLGTGEEGQAAFTLEVGMSTMTKGPKGSTLEYVELEGKSIEAGQKDLENLVGRMESLANSFLVKRPVGSRATATGMAIDMAENESDLGILARMLESELENMLDLFAIWMNMGPEAGGSVQVFQDFGIGFQSEKDLELLQKDRAAGDISQQTYWKEQKRRGLLSDDFDPEREAQLLDEESARTGDDLLEGTGEGAGPAGAAVGDRTGVSDGHTHLILEGGRTSEAAGHTHQWNPGATATSTVNGHRHSLAAAESDAAQGNGNGSAAA